MITELLSNPILLLLAGLVLLLAGARSLVDGSVSIAKKFNIPTIIIGMTIVAFGTSLPELIVNILSSLQDKDALAFGNIIGSNISNILLILGLTAIVYPTTVDKISVKRDLPFSIAITFFVLWIVSKKPVISLSDGVALLFMFGIFLYFTFFLKNKGGSFDDEVEVIKSKKLNSVNSIVFIMFGIFGLSLGGRWVVDGASSIATSFGISESVIGLTIVAIGTSLPELATSLVAAFKKESDIVIGNIIGSNIFNLLWILGLSAVINAPISIPPNAYIDVLVAALATIILFLMLAHKSPHELTRKGGIMFVSMYIIYVATIIMR